VCVVETMFDSSSLFAIEAFKISYDIGGKSVSAAPATTILVFFANCSLAQGLGIEVSDVPGATLSRSRSNRYRQQSARAGFGSRGRPPVAVKHEARGDLVFPHRDRGFESISLQRGVGYELDFGRDVEGERYLSLAERIRRGSIVPRIEVPLLVSRTDRNSLKGGPLGSFPSMAPKPSYRGKFPWRPVAALAQDDQDRACQRWPIL
jgi:hypothetical protein